MNSCEIQATQAEIPATSPQPDGFWDEHGWGLQGRHVALVLGVILIVCGLLHLLG